MSIFSLTFVPIYVVVIVAAILFIVVNSEIQTSSVGGYICVYDSVNTYTWYEAEAYCVLTYGSNLASIHSSDDENDFLNSFISNSEWTYFGLNDLVYEADRDGSIGAGWEYTDGTEYDFVISWAEYEPNAWDDCGAYSPSYYSRNGFHDVNCSYGSKQFVCNNNQQEEEFICASECSELTDAYGCGNDECLKDCDNCILGISWNDYEGGQDVSCQCHNNGCDQCKDGFFKIDYDFPCQSCSDSFNGCLHCTDFFGCQQCEDGYELVEDDTCGENSYHNTGNVKVHYCRKTSAYKSTTPSPTRNPTNSNPTVQCPNYDYDDYDSCHDDDKCEICAEWGCSKCEDGYYHMGSFKRCQSCRDNYPNCQTCGDWNGCVECDAGYSLIWQSECNDEICVQHM